MIPVQRATPGGLERRRIAVGESERTFWLASPPAGPAPLLVVLHGLGMDGPGMAQWTGLAERGPAAGFATVFPDGAGEIWADPAWLPDAGSRRGVDDAAFLRAIVAFLGAEDVAHGDPFLVGISNGAGFAEHVARHGLVRVTGLGLVAPSSRSAGREARPHPGQSVVALWFVGTGDRVAPYAGGRSRGLMALAARRRVRRRFGEPRWGSLVAVDDVVADWVAANGCDPDPEVVELAVAGGDPPVTRLSWNGRGAPGVTLYRIEGGGHSWPGGPAYVPAFLIGPVSRRLDATGILLEAARRTLGPGAPSSP